MSFDVVIVGIGGQGTILASDIIGISAMKTGYPVRASETHGMAQRGGSVENHIRINCELGPRIGDGEADLMIAMEPVEALRYSRYLSEKSVLLLNTHPIPPPGRIVGRDYPEVRVIEESLKKITAKVISENFTEVAKSAGGIFTLNMVMLGASTPFLPLDVSVIEETIRELVPGETIERNLSSFRKGRETVEKINNV